MPAGLDAPIPDQDGDLATAHHFPPVPPARFGDYELIEEIARGGMGVVWKARQLSLHRLVALKMIRAGGLASAADLQRFRKEAEAIAHLQHPHIVAIHEVGEHDGQPFFSMDHVAGRTLAEIVREGPLPAPRAAAYVKAIAEAVHYAHGQGILHRDLKPSNVIIDEHDQPRITDFGLAKKVAPASRRLETDLPQTGVLAEGGAGGTPALLSADLTLSGQVLGSPNYLPPEQAGGRHVGISAASDVYGLGAILYHLITGRPPFQADSLTTLLRQVLETEPVAPRLLNASLPRDIETTCLKCLEKEPNRRYASAQAVADELGRFLEKKPILARPVSVAGRVGRWCRRKPALAAALGAVVLVTVVGFVGILGQKRQAEEQRHEAERARNQAEHVSYAAVIAEAQLLIEQNRYDRAREILAREEYATNRGWEWGWLQRQCNLDLMTLTNSKPQFCTSFTPDGRFLVTGGQDAVARLWDLETGRLVRSFRGHHGWLLSAVFSPDGTRLVTASMDGSARVWETATAREILKLAGGSTEAIFSPDGKTIATADGYSGVALWDAQSGARLPIQAPYDRAVWSVAFSLDGRLLAYAGGPTPFEANADSRINLLDLSSGAIRSFKAHDHLIRRVRFSPTSKLLVTASVDGTARLWNPETTNEVRSLVNAVASESMQDADFSSNGQWVAVSSSGWQVARTRIFEVQSGQQLRSLQGHSINVPSIKFSQDGTRLATASYDGTAKVWSADNLPEFLSLEGHDQTVWAIAFSPEGRRLASGSMDLTARVWDTETGATLATLNVGFPVISLAWSPAGDRLVTVGPTNTACIWTVRAGGAALPRNPQPQSEGRDRSEPRAITDIEPRSSRREEALTNSDFAARNSESEISRTPAATNVEPVRLHGHTGSVMAVAWSADGRMILTGSKDGTARLWDAKTGALVRTIEAHTNSVLSVAFSNNGRWLATGGGGGAARLWEVSTGQLVRTLEGGGRWIQQVVFSPDGRRIAIGGEDRKVRLFDTENGCLLLPPLEGHRNGISSLAFSPDGMRLVTAGGGASLSAMWMMEVSVLLWDVQMGQRLLKLEPHSIWVVAAAFSPDGRRLATASGDNTIRIREAFPCNAEAYSGDAQLSLAEKVENFKRGYWRDKLQVPGWAVPLGTRPSQAGRRWITGATTESNLSIERGTKRWPALPIPPRAAHAGPDLVDLTTNYNAALQETWQPALGPMDVDRNLSSVPAGVTNLAGVSFDERGVIRLGRASLNCTVFPTNLAIAVGRKFHKLHVLHGTASPAQDGTHIGSYRLHYRDGPPTELTIVYGRDLCDAQVVGDKAGKPDAAKVAWTGPADVTQPLTSQSRLYLRTYVNPQPDHEVERITFESTLSSSGPFLLAMTIEP